MATRTTTKKAELKTSTAKPTTEKEAPAKKTTTVKAAVKGTVKKATTRKTTVRKTASKKAVSLNTEVYVQWLGKEVSEKDIVDSIKKIWERFYKTDLSRGKDKKGTGLGLSIVKEIIQNHGETIDVISTSGVGSEFIFSLPRAMNL